MSRKVTLRFAENQTEKVFVTPDILGDPLGAETFLQEQMRKTVPPGVVTGLAWTETGGDVLYIESVLQPNGVIPKDGPSAGVTMTTAMASLYSGLPARSDIAMTGEVRLAVWCP